MENIYNNPNPLEGPWPECVGWTGEECKDHINGWLAELAPPPTKRHPHEHFVRVVPQTRPYDPTRVWIQNDEYGKVISTPVIG